MLEYRVTAYRFWYDPYGPRNDNGDPLEHKWDAPSKHTVYHVDSFEEFDRKVLDEFCPEERDELMWWEVLHLRKENNGEYSFVMRRHMNNGWIEQVNIFAVVRKQYMQSMEQDNENEE